MDEYCAYSILVCYALTLFVLVLGWLHQDVYHKSLDIHYKDDYTPGQEIGGTSPGGGVTPKGGGGRANPPEGGQEGG